MEEKQNRHKSFTTCLEDGPCAEMLRTMLGQKGIGSLCAEMMKKMSAAHGPGGGPSCAEMLRSMMGAKAGSEEKQ